MTWHTMILNDPYPTRTGFISKYFANIDVAMSGSSWIWRQVDDSGNYVGSASSPFATEDAALDDALKQLNGDEWE